MTGSLEALRPVHGKPLKKNPWPGIAFVIVFHVLGIWALASGLANSTVQLLKGNIQAVVTTEEIVDDAPPPPPPPDFKPPPVVAIAPDVSIDLAVAAPTNTTAISNTPPAPPPPVAVAPPPPPPPPTEPVCIPADCTRAHAVTQDDYPPVSIRLQEQGQVLVKFVIAATGTVSQCEVERPSGKPRLDTAACNMVRRRWKYKPAMREGKPIDYADRANIVFQLR